MLPRRGWERKARSEDLPRQVRPLKGNAVGSPARPPKSQCLMSHPVSMSHCLNVSTGLGSQVSGLPLLNHHPSLAARWTRRWRSGNRRADMRPETRDLPGGHETLRQVEIAGNANGAPARPPKSQCLNVSPGLNVSLSQCLRRSRVSGLWSPPLTTTSYLAARSARRWRSGNRRADMRPETRDLPGGHETLRPPAGAAALVAAEGQGPLAERAEIGRDKRGCSH